MATLTAMVESTLRLSAQRALLGAIGPNVRLIKVARDGSKIVFAVIAAPGITEVEREALSVAVTEVIADFPESTICEEVAISAAPLPKENAIEMGWVYERME